MTATAGEGPASAAETGTWWGDFNLAPGDAHRWCVGPLTLWIQHLAGEWRIAWARDESESANQEHWSHEPGSPPPEGGVETQRFVFSGSVHSLRVRPVLADRSVVIHPFSPLSLVAGETATLYVSTPLWIRLAVGGEAFVTLLELPIARPSDTWFGPSTLVGELCYASRTHGRLSLAELPPRPHRALTPLEIRNKATKALVVERLSLPVPNLALYREPGGGLWTQPVAVERESETSAATLHLRDGAPAEAAGGELLEEPRRRPEGRVFKRALSAILG